jgi:hypothetical protein
MLARQFVRKMQTAPVNWFPGHMNKALNKLEEKMKMAQIVLEVRDARVCNAIYHLCDVARTFLQIPLSCANPLLRDLAKSKKRLIVLNKSDLADPTKEQVALHCGIHVIQIILCVLAGIEAPARTRLFCNVYEHRWKKCNSPNCG